MRQMAPAQTKFGKRDLRRLQQAVAGERYTKEEVRAQRAGSTRRPTQLMLKAFQAMTDARDAGRADVRLKKF